ncbi:hypothetical protein BKA70DRAFT_1418814 [Coprinopsis sp. MPI-PUGE-AT-0042]|nr:hypothetical protein BKA70DRAFT_1418814 [Coprinopsis sp. MPI-PUGE-AT-0042]
MPSTPRNYRRILNHGPYPFSPTLRQATRDFARQRRQIIEDNELLQLSPSPPLVYAQLNEGVPFITDDSASFGQGATPNHSPHSHPYTQVGQDYHTNLNLLFPYDQGPITNHNQGFSQDFPTGFVNQPYTVYDGALSVSQAVGYPETLSYAMPSWPYAGPPVPSPFVASPIASIMSPTPSTSQSSFLSQSSESDGSHYILDADFEMDSNTNSAISDASHSHFADNEESDDSDSLSYCTAPDHLMDGVVDETPAPASLSRDLAAEATHLGGSVSRRLRVLLEAAEALETAEALLAFRNPVAGAVLQAATGPSDGEPSGETPSPQNSSITGAPDQPAAGATPQGVADNTRLCPPGMQPGDTLRAEGPTAVVQLNIDMTALQAMVGQLSESVGSLNRLVASFSNGRGTINLAPALQAPSCICT